MVPWRVSTPGLALAAVVRPSTRGRVGLAIGGLRTAASGHEGVAEVARGGVDVALLDSSMPGLSAEDTLAALKAARPALPVVSLSGLGATLDGAAEHLLKPVTREALVATLEKVLARG